SKRMASCPIDPSLDTVVVHHCLAEKGHLQCCTCLDPHGAGNKGQEYINIDSLLDINECMFFAVLMGCEPCDRESGTNMMTN
ncbi:Hypothetical predicted protein, partial [Pelobates cultripes]